MLQTTSNIVVCLDEKESIDAAAGQVYHIQFNFNWSSYILDKDHCSSNAHSLAGQPTPRYILRFKALYSNQTAHS